MKMFYIEYFVIIWVITLGWFR